MLETDREAKRSKKKIQNMFQGLSTLILTPEKHIFQLKTKIQWAWDEKYADCWQECRFPNNNKQFKNGPLCILKCFHEKRCNNIKTATTKQTTKTTTTTTTTSTTTTTTKALGTTTSTTSKLLHGLLSQ